MSEAAWDRVYGRRQTCKRLFRERATTQPAATVNFCVYLAHLRDICFRRRF